MSKEKHKKGCNPKPWENECNCGLLQKITKRLKIKPCPNCKETKEECKCMRNKCIRCRKPVGNITFTVCDDCWDKC